MRTTLRLGALSAVVWLSGCADDGRDLAGPDTSPDTSVASAAILSNPVRGSGAAASSPDGAAPSAVAADVDGVAYVSLPAGTVPRGARAVIRNRASGFARAEWLVDGGLDPVPVPAAVGDTIEVLARDSAGATLKIAAVVPIKRPPKVVRTVPPKGRTDVPLNSVIIVVFSEPVSGQSVSPASIRLTRDGAPIGARVALSADGLRAELRPDQPLVANASYTLSISTEVTDLSGDRLEQPLEVRFTTGGAAAEIDRLYVGPSAVTLAPREALRLTASGLDRSGNWVADPAVTWSSADPTVATVSEEGVVTGVALGTATITATSGVARAEATIDVVELVFASVSAGATHTCALTTGGTAYCWGVGFLVSGGPSDTPAAVTGGLTFVQISSGGAHTCALTADGAAYCWGLNDVGQLGAAADEVCEGYLYDEVPCSSRPVAVTGGLRFTSISAGGGHTCGVTSDGAAYCWGRNRDGELGNGTTVGSTTPVAVAGGITFASVTAGRASWSGDLRGSGLLDSGLWDSGLTCGVTRQGQAYCWGTNALGQLGTGGFASSPTPAVVAGGLAFATVHAGRFHACGLTTSGTAHCWGMLGRAEGAAAVPRALPAERPYEAIELFSGDLLFSRICLVASGGTVYCRNGNESDLRALPIPGGIAFAGVSLGSSHACGIARDGRVYCWGLDEPVPVKVKGQP